VQIFTLWKSQIKKIELPFEKVAQLKMSEKEVEITSLQRNACLLPPS